MVRKSKKRKTRHDDILDLVGFSVGASAGVAVMNSLPDTPQVPAVKTAKGFAGAAMGSMVTLKGASVLMDGLKDLEKASRRKKRR